MRPGVGSLWNALAAVSALSAISPALAGSAVPTSARVYTFDIRDAELDAALKRYARITGRQILFRSEAVAGRPRRTLVGTYEAGRALSLLLKDLPLRADEVRPGMIVVVGTGPVAASGTGDGFRSTDGAAEADSPDGRVVVTGTTIRGRAPAGVEVTTIDRRAIDRSGRATIADVVALLPQNSGATGSDASTLGGIDRTSLNSTLASSPNLRGLGSDATLTLVNGRRQAGSGGRGDFTDLSAIPLAAVDRIEVLNDGASAIYGSDAVGGVVNVILRQGYRGLQTRLRSGVAEHGGPASYQASQLAGMRWSGGGVIAAYEFDRRGRLAAADRSRTNSADLRRFGGSDWRSYFAAPGTVLRLDPVARAYVPAFAIPSTTDRPRAADFVPGRNLQNQFELSDTLPLQERHSGYVRATQRLGDVELFVEGRLARRRFEYALPPSTATFAVTRANPFFASPDGAPVSVIAYSFAGDLGAIRASGLVRSESLTAGATAGVGGGWQLDAYYADGRERSRERSDNLVNTTALNEALGSSADNPLTPFSAARDGYFNPYGSGSSNSDAVLDFVGSGYSESWRRSSLRMAVGKLEGPLMRLPAGSIRAAVGGGWRREGLASGGTLFDSGTAPRNAGDRRASREIRSAFAELSLPVMDGSAGFGFGKLDVAAAVRWERYSDFGDTVDPKFGATWRLGGGVDLRASYGTSFRSPALPEVFAPFQVAPTQLPTAAGVSTPVLFMSGGNPGLKPETANTLTLGATVRAAQALTVSVGYFHTSFADRIDRPALQAILRALTDPIYAPFVTLIDPSRNPADLQRVQQLLAGPGAIDPNALPATSYRAIVDGRYVNTARSIVEGIDLTATWRRTFSFGDVGASVSAAYLMRYAQQLTPAAPLRNLMSTVGNPVRLKARSSLDWSRRDLGATLAANFVGAYRDKDSTPSRPIARWLTFDLQLRATPPAVRAFTFAVDVRNLFGRPPPFVDRAGGVAYDPANADVLGRTFAVQLTKSW